VSAPRLGLRPNLDQLALLVLVNALVGATVGVERSVLPLVGERSFGVGSSTGVLAFIVAFGAAKALANLAAGRLADARGRRMVLVAGWTLALPVPLVLALAPSWSWIVAANALLGVSQGLTWSMTIVMKVDLVGSARRGLALGVNEAAGYGGVAVAAAASGFAAALIAPRTVVWAGMLALVVTGLTLSLAFARETSAHASLDDVGSARTATAPPFAACAQAGFVNNLNDALAWGLVPLFLAAHGASPEEVGVVAGVYPAVWGLGQLVTGPLSDAVGRSSLIVGGMVAQGIALFALAAGDGSFGISFAAALVLGIGTAGAYPTLLAAVSDGAAPAARAWVIGRYRFWRDVGLVVGAVGTGVGADAIGAGPTIAAVGLVTVASGIWFVVAGRAPRRTIGSYELERS
jgi:MFS family permease